MFSKQSLQHILGILIVLAFIGCNKPDANRSVVTGEVKLDGKPLERGSILFTPIDGTKGKSIAPFGTTLITPVAILNTGSIFPIAVSLSITESTPAIITGHHQ